MFIERRFRHGVCRRAVSRPGNRARCGCARAERTRAHGPGGALGSAWGAGLEFCVSLPARAHVLTHHSSNVAARSGTGSSLTSTSDGPPAGRIAASRAASASENGPEPPAPARSRRAAPVRAVEITRGPRGAGPGATAAFERPQLARREDTCRGACRGDPRQGHARPRHRRAGGAYRPRVPREPRCDRGETRP